MHSQLILQRVQRCERAYHRLFARPIVGTLAFVALCAALFLFGRWSV